jgi:hypothetical protein
MVTFLSVTSLRCRVAQTDYVCAVRGSFFLRSRSMILVSDATVVPCLVTSLSEIFSFSLSSLRFPCGLLLGPPEEVFKLKGIMSW